MRIAQIIAGICAGLLLLVAVITPLTYAAPPEPAETPESQADDPPANGSAIRPASAVLDLDAAAVSLPAESLGKVQSAAGQPPTNLPVMVEYDGESGTIREIEHKIIAADVGAADLTTPLTERYETGSVSSNPNLHQLTDGNGNVGGVYSWGAENCYSTTGFPVNFVGSYSAWVAGTTISDPILDPCPGTNDTYPPNMNAWLVYGPFDLSDVQNASLDFFYRYDSPDPDDYLFWGASTDGFNFEGFRVFTDVYTSGPFPNDHNFVSFDLTDVPVLGDVTGQPQVYLAFLFVSDDDGNTGQGAFIDSLTLRANDGQRKEIIIEPFENTFPSGYESWLSHDNNNFDGGNQRWGSADCNAQSGNQAMWMARLGAEGFDPCSTASFDALKNRNLEPWLLYGPFNLEQANEAWVEFYFRSDTEQQTPGSTIIATDDIFYWWASIDGKNYYGPGVSGTYLDGPYGNGHNLMRFDLSNVATIGDLRGQKNVWISFVMDSDIDSNFGQDTEEGVFLDDVKIVTFEGGGKPANAVYLPVLIKSEQPEVGGITFRNFTGNPVVIELVDFGTRRFPGTTGPHVWDDIPVGEYDWIASGTCPVGAGQIGSDISSRPEVEIIADSLENDINDRGSSVNVFDCSG